MEQHTRSWGPFASRAGEFIAYVVGGSFAGSDRLVCLVASSADAGVLESNLEALFLTVLREAAAKLENWQQFPCYSGILQPGARQLHTSTYTGPSTAPEQIAEDILGTMVQHRVVESGDRNFLVTVYETDPASGFTTYEVRSEAGGSSFRLMAKSLEELTQVLKALPDVSEYEAGMYFLETVMAIERRDMRSAFRSFYHGLVLHKGTASFNSEAYLNVGLALAEGLRESLDSDKAEWVAATTGALAVECGQNENAVKAFHLAGMLASDLGWIQETEKHYQKAVSHLDASIPPDVAASLHQSYGLSLVSLLAHTDFEPDAGRGAQVRISKMLDTAERQLQLARSLTEAGNHPRKGFRLAAIALDLARIADLRGRHEEAIRLLDALTLTEDKHFATRLVYRLAATRHLAIADQDRLTEYQTALNTALRELMALSTRPAERACWCFLAFGEMAQALGRWDDAVIAFSRARDALQAYLGPMVRAPGSTVLLGGLFAIDISGRLQQALAATAGSHADGQQAAWQAFALADTAKGRFFSRDLILSAASGPNLSPYLDQKERDLRERIVRGTLDPRIALADYEWFLEHDAGKQAKESRELTATARQSVIREDIPALLETLDGPAMFLSLYCTRDCTFVYLFNHPDREPNVAIIEIDRESVLEAARYLMVGTHGNAVYPKIDASKPEKQDAFFRPFLELQSAFAGLMQWLKPCRLLLISAHDIWHALPIHALLLPLFWGEELCPGIAYVPSARIANLLKRRSESPNRLRIRTAALTSVPANGQESLFLSSHQTLMHLFEGAGLPVKALYGSEATPEQTLAASANAGLHHILAHGKFEENDEAMRSALLLADGETLPSIQQVEGGTGYGRFLTASALMASGTAARHITLHACSVGRNRAGVDDELWGMTRAALAGGADSVLAPIWEVDLASSTELLGMFYEKWLLEDLSKPRALTEAQWQLSKSVQHPEWSHFYHWGAFQYYGL